MENKKLAYCSWCLRKTTHQVREAPSVNSSYFCEGCEKPTKSCVAPTCNEQSRNLDFIPKEFSIKEFGKPFEYYRNLYCAQHSGIIPSFESLYQKIDDLSDYETFKTNRNHNLKKYTDRALFFIVIAATGIDFMPGEVTELAPDEAMSVDDNPQIDEESIDIIQSDKALKGALLTSVTMGVAFTNPNFRIIQQDKGIAKSKQSIIFINGFLTQGKLDFLKWNNGFNKYMSGFNKYSIDWDSKSISPNNPIHLIKKKFVKNAYALEIISKWFGAKDNCVMTARGLAAVMSRTKLNDYVDLAGHSLGSLFIQTVLDQYTLLGHSPIRNIYLFGGAVDNDKHLWEKQINKIHGKVYNFYSDNDDILKIAYQSTTFFSSTPIGLAEIQVNSNKIINVDVSHIVNGHNEYKSKLQECLDYANTIHPIKGRWYERLKLFLLMKLYLKRCFKKSLL